MYVLVNDLVVLRLIVLYKTDRIVRTSLSVTVPLVYILAFGIGGNHGRWNVNPVVAETTIIVSFEY